MKAFKRTLLVSLCAGLCVFMLAGCSFGDKDKNSSSDVPMTSSSNPEATMTPSPSPSMSPSPSGSPSMSPSPSVVPEMASNNENAAAAGSADLSKIGALDGANVPWGPGLQFAEDNRPTAPITLQEKYEKYGCVFLGDSASKTIYLTFDQGYENGYTEKILDTLRDKQVPAVFFLTGHYVESAPELITRMVDEGHTLGNHSNKHYDMTEVPLDSAKKDMNELREMVSAEFGVDCKLYRFPEGKFSEQGLALVQDEGCTPVFWSFAYNDWDPKNQPDPSGALEKLTARLHNGAVYLLHSVSATNAQILGDFIDEARAQGFEFAAVPA